MTARTIERGGAIVNRGADAALLLLRRGLGGSVVGAVHELAGRLRRLGLFLVVGQTLDRVRGLHQRLGGLLVLTGDARPPALGLLAQLLDVHGASPVWSSVLSTNARPECWVARRAGVNRKVAHRRGRRVPPGALGSR